MEGKAILASGLIAAAVFGIFFFLFASGHIFGMVFIAPVYFTNFLLAYLYSKSKRYRKYVISKKIFGSHRNYSGVATVLVCLPGFYAIMYATLGGGVYQGAITGLVMAIGMVGGILGSSALKRRIGLKPGQDMLFVDQLDIIIGTGISYFVFFGQAYPDFPIVLAVTFILHPLGNIFLYHAGVKKDI